MRYVYPKLKRIDSRDGECKCTVKLSDDAAALAKRVGLDFGTHEEETHTLTLAPLAEYGEGVYSKEQFAVSITENEITVYADTGRTASYGLKRVHSMQKYGNIKMGKFRDWPSTTRRGIIEGFYGTPWTLEQEKAAIHQLWENGMNTYIYSPKDDEYHRAKWSELYPEDKLTNLLTLLHTCDNDFVDFYYMLAPGLSIKYSSENDFDLLIKKYRQIYDLGVRHLGLLLDDIPKELIHEEDKAAYTDYCEAHIELCLKAYNALKEIDPEVSFTICPTIYRGNTAQDYIVRMGKAMPEDVSIFWTGPAVCSFDLTESHTAAFLKNTGHKPLYWDNYPVNDYTMLHEMHIEPIRFRDYGIATLSDGVIANVMEYMEASMLSVITYAHFCWEPNAYDQLRSYNDAIEQCLGTKSIVGAQIFMEFCYKSYISYHYHEKFSRLLLSEHVYKDILGDYASYCKLELCRLRDNCENRAFIKEVGRWLDKAILFCCLVGEYCAVIGDKSGLEAKIEAYLEDPTDVCKYEAGLLLEKVRNEVK